MRSLDSGLAASAQDDGVKGEFEIGGKTLVVVCSAGEFEEVGFEAASLRESAGGDACFQKVSQHTGHHRILIELGEVQGDQILRGFLESGSGLERADSLQ
jgi:hypothetical protein